MSVDLKLTPEEKEKSFKYTKLRGKMKAPHTTGREGVVNRAGELKRKKKADGSQPSRLELYISSHTRADGTALATESSNTVILINQLIKADPPFRQKDLDNDAITKVCGKG